MLIEHGGARPKVDATARVAPNAVLCGDVTIGPNSSVGFGAVITAESGKVTIGANCVIMDTAVIRGVRSDPVSIADNVLVGPRAYLCGSTLRKCTMALMRTSALWPIRAPLKIVAPVARKASLSTVQPQR